MKLSKDLASEIKALGFHVVTAAQTQNFTDLADVVSIPSWPEFMLHDEIANTHWSLMVRNHPEFQFALVETNTDRWVAVGNSIPVRWDGKLEDLPDEGWDWAMISGNEDLNWNMVSAIAIEIHPDMRGKGLSTLMIRIMRENAKHHGYTKLIGPVRPNKKHEFPHMSMEAYIEKKKGDERFDPWMRVHERLGAKVIKVCHKAMRIPGTIEEWQKWTGQTFTKSGSYVIDKALVPINIDVEKDSGVYVEPNVWMVHTIKED